MSWKQHCCYISSATSWKSKKNNNHTAEKHTQSTGHINKERSERLGFTRALIPPSPHLVTRPL